MLKEKDFDVYSIIQKEKTRQTQNIELIASENFVSVEVLEAQGSILTNKYAEGYPGKSDGLSIIVHKNHALD